VGTSDGAAIAAATEGRRLELARATARESGDWRVEIEAGADLLQFYMQNALVLGLDETGAKFEQLAKDLLALVDSILQSDQAPEDAAEREELERTKLAIHAAVQSFGALAGAARLKAVMSAAADAAAEGDFGRASEAAAAGEVASRELLAGTEGATEGWPEELRHKRANLRDRAAASIAGSRELQQIAAAVHAGEPLADHPRQIAARMKLIEVQPEVAEARRRVEAIRRDLRTGSLRRRAIILVALAFAAAGLRLLEKVERSYARSAARAPRSSVLFERARSKREEAAIALEASERHRQASGAALDAPVGSPWIASAVQFLVGWVILGAGLTANYVVFALFDVNYFRWYVDNGALISLVFAFVSLAVQLDDYPNLVSSNPLRYVFACWTLNFHLFLAWNQVIAVDPERAKGVMLAKLFDTIVSFFAMLAVTVAFIGWLLVVAPIQHVAYAVLGAPARNVLRNPAGPRYDPQTDTTVVTSAETAGSGRAFGYVDKPVTLTSALAAAALWLFSEFVS
jgi:hypothetical protein